MTRKLKALEVGEVKHVKLAAPVKVFYDRADKKFFGTIPGNTITATEQRACERLIYEAISELVQLEWQRVIVVQRLRPFAYSGGGNRVEPFVGFEMHRHEVAKQKTADGERSRWLERDWRDDSNTSAFWKERWINDGDAKTFYHPEEKQNGEHTVVLPYTDELWANLSALQDRVTQAGEQLTQMLNSPDLPKILAQARVSLGLLPAGRE